MASGGAVFRRELFVAARTPLWYALAAGVLAAAGYLVGSDLISRHRANVPEFVRDLGVALVVALPLLTAGAWSEERRQQTAELLLSAPLTLGQIVAGKFASGAVQLAALLVASTPYALWLYRAGGVDPGGFAAGYAGLFLFGCALLAIGLLASCLTRHLALAAVGTYACLGLLRFLGFIGDSIGAGAAGLALLSPLAHLHDFALGAIDLADVVYYLSVVACALSLAVFVLARRRWRA